MELHKTNIALGSMFDDLVKTKKPENNVFRLFAERGGFEPPVPISQYVSLANWWIKPLSHLSVGMTKLRNRLTLTKEL